MPGNSRRSCSARRKFYLTIWRYVIIFKELGSSIFVLDGILITIAGITLKLPIFTLFPLKCDLILFNCTGVVIL
jgi:hypothetical protein